MHLSKLCIYLSIISSYDYDPFIITFNKINLCLQFPPENFVETMKLMEHRYGAKDFVTSNDCSYLLPGTFYLTKVDSMYRRFYARKDTTST